MSNTFSGQNIISEPPKTCTFSQYVTNIFYGVFGRTDNTEGKYSDNQKRKWTSEVESQINKVSNEISEKWKSMTNKEKQVWFLHTKLPLLWKLNMILWGRWNPDRSDAELIAESRIRALKEAQERVYQLGELDGIDEQTINDNCKAIEQLLIEAGEIPEEIELENQDFISSLLLATYHPKAGVILLVVVFVIALLFFCVK